MTGRSNLYEKTLRVHSTLSRERNVMYCFVSCLEGGQNAKTCESDIGRYAGKHTELDIKYITIYIISEDFIHFIITISLYK